MSYMYTANLNPEQMETAVIIEVLALANLYSFVDLRKMLLEYLGKHILDGNIPIMSNQADCHSINPSEHARSQLMCRKAVSVLKCEALNHLPLDILGTVLSWCLYRAEEIEVFEALEKWCSKNPQLREYHPTLFDAVRHEVIEVGFILNIIGEYGLIPLESVVEAILEDKLEDISDRCRAVWKLKVNLASREQGATILEPYSPKSSREPRSFPIYDRFKMPSSDSDLIALSKKGLIVALEQTFFINRISFTLRDSSDEISCYVEISVNLFDWIVVGDSKCISGSEQRLHFEDQAARFIRINFTKKPDDGLVSLSKFRVCGSDAKRVRFAGAATTGSKIPMLVDFETLFRGHQCKERSESI